MGLFVYVLGRKTFGEDEYLQNKADLTLKSVNHVTFLLYCIKSYGLKVLNLFFKFFITHLIIYLYIISL